MTFTDQELRRLRAREHLKRGPPFTDQQLIELYEQGLNDREIAEKLVQIAEGWMDESI